MPRTRKTSKPRVVSCDICKSAFETTHSQGKYCSSACQRQGWQGHWRGYADRNRQSRRNSGNRIYRNDPEKKADQVRRYRKTEQGKRVVKAAHARQCEKFPEKIAARRALGEAIRYGRMTKKPCEVCGAIEVHGHHTDYSKPLEVTWLCPKHHDAEHRRKNCRE